VKDIAFARTVHVVVQYLHLWDTQRDFRLCDQLDRFIWGVLLKFNVPCVILGGELILWVQIVFGRFRHLEDAASLVGWYY
jgi:hypothetical protein